MLEIGTASLLTTVLDDDDTLPRSFTQQMRTLVSKRAATTTQFPPLAFGFSAPLQWDLDFIKCPPFGSIAPWHRRRRGGVTYPLSCGLTLLAPDHYYDLCVLGLEHVSSQWMFDADFKPINPLQRNGVRLLRAAAGQAGYDWTTWSSQANFVLLDDIVPAPLILNHGYNDQESRLAENKEESRAVLGPQSLPEIALDWTALTNFVSSRQLTRPRTNPKKTSPATPIPLR